MTELGLGALPSSAEVDAWSRSFFADQFDPQPEPACGLGWALVWPYAAAGAAGVGVALLVDRLLGRRS